MIPLGPDHGPGWAPADVQLPGGAWVLGWARADMYQAGAKYVLVHYVGASKDHATFHRSRVVLR